MQMVIEGLALSAFTTMKATTPERGCSTTSSILVTRDEARHVTFGINYLEEFVKNLSEDEREERARSPTRPAW